MNSLSKLVVEIGIGDVLVVGNSGSSRIALYKYWDSTGDAWSVVECVVEDVNKAVDADQVAVLVVALLPLDVVRESHAFGKWPRLAKVDHPDVGLAVVVNEEQRGTDHLKAARRSD